MSSTQVAKKSLIISNHELFIELNNSQKQQLLAISSIHSVEPDTEIIKEG